MIHVKFNIVGVVGLNAVLQRLADALADADEDTGNHDDSKVCRGNDTDQRYTGRSFQDNLQDIRMQMAKTLLKEDKLSVEAIAERLGYATASNFRKIFKKYYNLSPKQYQMNRRSKAL